MRLRLPLHGRSHLPQGSDPIRGIGGLQYGGDDPFYGAENVGDWLDVAATALSPAGIPIRFDVSVDDLNWGDTSPHGVGLGGFVVEAISTDNVTYAGITSHVEGDTSSTLDGYSLYMVGGGTVIGHHDEITVPDATYMAGTKGRYEATGSGSSVFAIDVSALGLAASSIGVLRGEASATSTTGNTELTGADLVLNGDGSDVEAFGVRAILALTDAATGYSGWFEGGKFKVKLGAGETITIHDSSDNPKIQWTEGTNDLHIPTGGTIVADL